MHFYAFWPKCSNLFKQNIHRKRIVNQANAVLIGDDAKTGDQGEEGLLPGSRYVNESSHFVSKVFGICFAERERPLVKFQFADVDHLVVAADQQVNLKAGVGAVPVKNKTGRFCIYAADLQGFFDLWNVLQADLYPAKCILKYMDFARYKMLFLQNPFLSPARPPNSCSSASAAPWGRWPLGPIWPPAVLLV